jgi:hypothetical protein
MMSRRRILVVAPNRESVVFLGEVTGFGWLFWCVMFGFSDC